MARKNNTINYGGIMKETADIVNNKNNEEIKEVENNKKIEENEKIEENKKNEDIENYIDCGCGLAIKNDENLLLVKFNTNISQASLYVKNNAGEIVKVENSDDFIMYKGMQRPTLVLIKESDFFLKENSALNNSMSHYLYLCIRKNTQGKALKFLKINDIDFNKKIIKCNALQMLTFASSTMFMVDDKAYITEDFYKVGSVNKIFTLDDKNFDKNSSLHEYVTHISECIHWITDELIKSK